MATGAGERQRRATVAADEIRRRFGDRAVTRARLLGADLPAPFERDPMKPLERRTGMPEAVRDDEGRHDQRAESGRGDDTDRDNDDDRGDGDEGAGPDDA